MAERRTPPSTEPIYSERDLTEMRLKWEESEKDKRMAVQLGEIAGQLKQIPETVKTIARQVVLEVLSEQRDREDKRNHDVRDRQRSDRRFLVGALASLVVIVVPLESAILGRFFHP